VNESVVVTGAAGFIGSHVAEALLRRGVRVVGIDNFDPFYETERKRANIAAFGGEFVLYEIDIRNHEQMRGVFSSERPTGVIHLAARAGVRPSLEDPVGYADVNVTGTQVVLGCAHEAGCARVVAASSSSVYGNNKKTPFAEDDPVEHPISPYAATKRACELIAHTHHHVTGMPTAMLRFFTVFGPRQRPDLAIAKFMRLIASGEAIPVFGDGSTSRDYTYIDDIVTGVLAAYDRIDAHGFRVWNLGGDHPTTLGEMIDTVAQVVGHTPTIDRRGMQPGDVERTWADLSRSRSELRYTPTTGLGEGVERQWSWWRSTA